MRLILSFLVYLALSVVANTALASDKDLTAFLVGDLKKLTIHKTPRPVSPQTFLGDAQADQSLDQYRGQVIVLNFWATWCAPCREEMPSLSALQSRLGGEDMQVVTIATGPNPRPAIERFFSETNIDNLPLFQDPKQALARDMRVLGLPVTVVIDREGREIARLQGEADWNSEAAVSLLETVMAR